jgi:hypothetical protein
MFTGTIRPPVLFSVGEDPFLSLVSIAPPPEELQAVRLVRRMAKWLWHLVVPPSAHHAAQEWTPAGSRV